MMGIRWLAPLAIAAASLYGCASPIAGDPPFGGGTGGNSTDPGGSAGDASTGAPGSAGDASSPGSGPAGDGSAGGGSATSIDGGAGTGSTGSGATTCGPSPGTFCDVQAITQKYKCVTCHAATPIGGAPMSLITYADFLAPAKSNPAKTVAALVLERTTAKTMPPAGFTPVADGDLATIQSWITAGSSASCVAPTPMPGCIDAGAGTGGGAGAPDAGGRVATADGGAGTGTGGGATGGTGTAGADAGAVASLCAVQDVIQRNTCLNCHGATPVNGAPMSLVTFANLTAPAVSDPTKTVGQLVVVRTTARTMPPGGVPAVSAADIQTVQTWLDAGSPSTCPSTPPPTTGGGATGDAGAGTTTPPPAGGGGTTTINPVVGTSASDPWCAVVRDVAPTCAACHASPPRGGAPMSLLTYADWITHAVTQPTVIVGQLALARMSAGTMPPGGGASATQIADVQAWVSGGMANSTCGTAGDAGAVVVDPFGSAPTCTSGRTMTTPNGPTMRPGEACLNCHTAGGGGGEDNGGGGEGEDDDAVAYALGGTVYPTAHEPNDCVGAINGGGSVVTVVDSAGRTISLTPNAVGNFFYEGAITFPITARITRNGLSRSMTTPQTTGNCNACHTQTGANGAPGRILEPF